MVVAIVAGVDVATQATANVFVARSSGDKVVATLAMDAIVALTAEYAVVSARTIVRGSVLYVIVATQSAYPVIIDGANQSGPSVPIKASARATPPTISSVAVISQNCRTNLLNTASVLLDLPTSHRTSRVTPSATAAMVAKDAGARTRARSAGGSRRRGSIRR